MREWSDHPKIHGNAQLRHGPRRRARGLGAQRNTGETPQRQKSRKPSLKKWCLAAKAQRRWELPRNKGGRRPQPVLRAGGREQCWRVGGLCPQSCGSHPGLKQGVVTRSEVHLEVRMLGLLSRRWWLQGRGEGGEKGCVSGRGRPGPGDGLDRSVEGEGDTNGCRVSDQLKNGVTAFPEKGLWSPVREDVWADCGPAGIGL